MSRTTASTPKRAGSSATSLSGADVRTGLDSTALQQAVLDHLHYSLGRLPAVATPGE